MCELPRADTPPLYRFYRLNPDGGILSAEVIEAADDPTALAAAQAMAHRLCVNGYEVWDRGRPVRGGLAPA